MKVKVKKIVFLHIFFAILTTLTREGFSADRDDYGPIPNFKRQLLRLQLVTATCAVVLSGITTATNVLPYLWKRLIGPSFMPDRSTVIPAPDLFPTAYNPCTNILSSTMDSFKDISFQNYSSLAETVAAKSKMNLTLVFEMKYYEKANETGNCLEYNGNTYKIDDSPLKYHHDTFWEGRPWHQQIGILMTAHIDPLCYVDTFLEQVQAQAATCSLSEADINRDNPDRLAFENLTGKYFWQRNLELTDPEKAKLMARLLEKFGYSQFVEVTTWSDSDEICVVKSPTFIPYQFKKRKFCWDRMRPLYSARETTNLV